MVVVELSVSNCVWEMCGFDGGEPVLLRCFAMKCATHKVFRVKVELQEAVSSSLVELPEVQRNPM
jgi:hypothetical protein